jgi:hypothetical protein
MTCEKKNQHSQNAIPIVVVPDLHRAAEPLLHCRRRRQNHIEENITILYYVERVRLELMGNQQWSIRGDGSRLPRRHNRIFRLSASQIHRSSSREDE